MDSVVRKKIENQEIIVDGKTLYVNCTLVKCKIIYPGGDSPFMNCNLDNCDINFVGEAGRVVQFLHNVGMFPPPQMPAAVHGRDAGGVH